MHAIEVSRRNLMLVDRKIAEVYGDSVESTNLSGGMHEV